MASFNALPLILGAGGALGAFLSEEGANEAAQEATQLVTQGQQQAGQIATNAFQQGAQARAAGFDEARGDITGGTTGAINALRAGTVGATGALEAGTAGAGQAIRAGTTGAIGEQRDTLARALERLNPELLSARGAQNLLNDALGVNGPEAQERFFSNFQDDPGFQAELQDRINAVDRSAAARGQLLSGRTLQEVGDVGQRFRRGAFTDRLNRLRQAAAGAPDIAARGANLISGAGTNIANALLAQGTNLANLESGEGINIANLLAGEGRGTADLLSAQGTNLANLATRAGEAEAGGFENVGNVLAQRDINISNALARGALAPAQNRANTINALLRAAGSASSGLPEDFLSFNIGP